MNNNYTILHCHDYLSNAVTNEEWKDITGFEGKYQVSNLGRIKSFPNKSRSTERILNPWKNCDGYLLVDLCKDGKVYHKRVNKLVLDTFVGCIEDGFEVGHKDEDKLNNKLSNLEYVTHKQNCQTPERNKKLKHKPFNEVMCDGILYHSVMECANNLGVRYKTMWMWLHGNINMPDDWRQRGLKYVK